MLHNHSFGHALKVYTSPIKSLCFYCSLHFPPFLAPLKLREGEKERVVLPGVYFSLFQGVVLAQ